MKAARNGSFFLYLSLKGRFQHVGCHFWRPIFFRINTTFTGETLKIAAA